MREARKRSILKALTWRVIATSTTMVLAYAATGDLKVAGAIGAADVVIKLFFTTYTNAPGVAFHGGGMSILGKGRDKKSAYDADLFLRVRTLSAIVPFCFARLPIPAIDSKNVAGRIPLGEGSDKMSEFARNSLRRF